MIGGLLLGIGLPVRGGVGKGLQGFGGGFRLQQALEGRHGNAEAARRAGVSIVRIRTLAFTLCGLTAGITGIIYASYLGSISTNVNGGQNVLNAVAAAVIGGGAYLIALLASFLLPAPHAEVEKQAEVFGRDEALPEPKKETVD